MSPTRVSAQSVLVAALMIAAFAGSIHAQDAEPSVEAPAVDEKARSKPRLKSKPVRPKAMSTAAPSQMSAATPNVSALWPAGATTVSESYGDWTMTCVRPSEKAACVVAQSQGDSKTGRRKFGIELKRPQDGYAEGVVVMPFGLAIEPGITFKLDDQVLGKGAPYTSCTGEGCLVPISFPMAATDAMRTAKTLTVTGRKAGGSAAGDVGEAATIAVPLVGFSQAFDRAGVLGGH
jgi:invasion protein IalB